MTIVGLAPNRHGAIHAQGGAHAWLEGRPRILTIPLGHPEGDVLLLSTLIIPPDTAGGGLNVHVAALHANPRGSPAGTGREECDGPHVIEASQDAPYGIVVKGLGREGLAQEQCCVLGGKALVHTVEGAAATEGIQDQPQHDRARVHVHRRGHVVSDESDAAPLGSVGCDHGPRVDGVHLDRGRSIMHGSLPGGVLADGGVLVASTLPW
jgi:hypothetical protein